MKEKTKIIELRVVKIIIAVVLAVVFYFAGYLIGHKNLVFEANYKPKIANKELMKPRSVDFGIFWQAWDKIEKEYVGTPDYQKMVYGAVKGMVEALGDPYSVFMEPGESKTFMEDLSGEISGIGAQIDKKDTQLLIIAPLADSPAEKVGLKPQDQILFIDDLPTEPMTLEEAISKIRGKAGTKVKLTIMREGFSEPKVFEITREKITVKSVKWEIKNDNVAYIEISQFGDDTVDLMQKAAKEINAKNPKAIILDLRSNPGGYLEGSVDVASLWMDKGVVVKEKYKDGRVEELETTLEPILGKYKTIVLINGGSASASEIVAGALQDTGKATLVGEKSYGKGSVQDLEDLAKGASLKLTIAEWLTPKDREINTIGITPDVVVELTEDDHNAGRDPQLDKAIDLLK